MSRSDRVLLRYCLHRIAHFKSVARNWSGHCGNIIHVRYPDDTDGIRQAADYLAGRRIFNFARDALDRELIAYLQTRLRTNIQNNLSAIDSRNQP